MRLLDSTVLITGANRGLGLAVAGRLALLGAHVILAGRDGCVDAADALVARGLHAEAYEFDATESRSTAALGAFCASRGVDVFVNNAAVCDAGWSRGCVRRTLRTNLLAPRELTRAVLPGMLRRRRGCVINVSSGDGELVYLDTGLQDRMRSLGSERELLRLLARVSRGRGGFDFPRSPPTHGPTPAYALSKAALNAYTRLAARGIPRPSEGGVWLAAVCPGDVQTRMCTLEPPEDALRPEEAAEGVVWLAAAAGDADPSLVDAPGRRELETGRFWRHREEIPF